MYDPDPGLLDAQLRELLPTLSPDEIEELTEDLPPGYLQTLLDELGGLSGALTLAADPRAQAFQLMPEYADRPHLRYLSDRIAAAVRDVENGTNRRLIVEMPPRAGKSLTATQITPGWILAAHPTWDIMLTSYSRNLATSWGRQIRRWVSEGKLGPHLAIAPDSGAVENWETTEGGRVASRSVGSDITGFGAKVLIIDDPHKNFAEAHSEANRKGVWNWWLSDVQTRLQPPSLVIVIMTRWHEDDLVGRLLSHEYEGDPNDWEVIRLPAIAEEDDVLGRAKGDPLYSPLIDETRESALERWEGVRKAVGSYTWSALYQQRPSPAEGSIFLMDDWRYWTTDPALASRDADGEIDPEGKVVYLDPERLASADWVDSWDFTFSGSDSSDYTVGQRWAKLGANRYLIAQQRGRKTFPQALEAMEAWAKIDDPIGSPYGRHVHRRLVENKANGPAIIATLRDKIAGLKPIMPNGSKEARARAVSPEVESGNVFLPFPGQDGHAWVQDLLSELREFPTGAHDDQVDAMTQALLELREGGVGSIGLPGASAAGLTAEQLRAAIPGLPTTVAGRGRGDRIAAARSLGRR